MDNAELQRALFEAFEELKFSPQLLDKHNCWRITSAAGIWKIRNYLCTSSTTGRQTYTFSAKGPGGEDLRTRAHIAQLYTPPPPAPQTFAEFVAAMPPGLSSAAVITIVRGIRYLKLARVKRALAEKLQLRSEMQVALCNIQAELQNIDQKINSNEYQNTTLLHSIGLAPCIDDTVLDYMSGTEKSYLSIDTPYYAVGTHFTRALISENAVASSFVASANANTRWACSTIQHYPTYPRILGKMKLPLQLYKFEINDTTYWARSSASLSTEHRSNVMEVFDADFVTIKLEPKIIKDGGATTYDISIDGKFTKESTKGFLVLTKYAVKYAGRLCPAIAVESISARGYGREVINIVRRLLFDGIIDPTIGFIFGQCIDLDSRFWDTLDITNDGRCLVYQTHLMYDAAIEDNCTIRCATVFFPSPTASP